VFHIQNQNEEGFFSCTDDQGRLTVDLPKFGAGGRRPQVLCSQEEADDADPSNNLAPRRSFDFASAIGPEGDLFGQEIHQGVRLPSHHGLQKTVEQLVVLIRRGLEAWPTRPALGDRRSLQPLQCE